MVKACTYFFFVSLLIVSCSSPKDKLNEQLSTALRENPCLHEQEYTNAKEYIEAYPEEFPKLVDNTKKLNHYAFTAYISALARNLKIPFDTSCCWTPEEFRQQLSPFNVNVFIENSASMDGYVKETTQFNNAIYNLLSVINLSDLCDSMNLNYINQSIPYSIVNASDSAINTFAKNLRRNDFINRGGNRTGSDLLGIMARVLQQVDERNMAMVVTDCVYSPGKTQPDALGYLGGQQTGLMNVFYRKLNQQPICFLMFQLQSEFHGSYYDRLNMPHKLNGDLRPYYIMIAATRDQLAALYGEKLFDKVNWEIQHQLVFEPVFGNKEADIKIVRLELVGECEIDNTVKPHKINNATISEGNKEEKRFSFYTAVSFKHLFASQEYIMDTLNYIVSNPAYSLTVQPVEMIKNEQQFQGFQYGMRLSTTHLATEELNVQLRSRIPPWVFGSSSADDRNIDQDAQEKTKTFGLEYFVRGIYDAYCMYNNRSGNSTNAYYVLGQFTISIHKEK